MIVFTIEPETIIANVTVTNELISAIIGTTVNEGFTVIIKLPELIVFGQ
jgi:hypothetical protein